VSKNHNRQKKGDHICLIMSRVACVGLFLRDFVCSLLATTRIVRPRPWIFEKGVVYMSFLLPLCRFVPFPGPVFYL
jgi:hypothetical protein